jgi:hypothetical protein
MIPRFLSWGLVAAVASICAAAEPSGNVPHEVGFYVSGPNGRWTRLAAANVKRDENNSTAPKGFFAALGTATGMSPSVFTLQASGSVNSVSSWSDLSIAYRGPLTKERDDNTGLVRLAPATMGGYLLSCVKRSSGQLFPESPAIIRLLAVEHPEADLTVMHPALTDENAFAVYSGESEIYVVTRDEKKLAGSSTNGSAVNQVNVKSEVRTTTLQSTPAKAPPPSKSSAPKDAEAEFAKLIQQEASGAQDEYTLIADYRDFARRYSTNKHSAEALDRARAIEEAMQKRQRDAAARAARELN